jgi:hypothetical protein
MTEEDYKAFLKAYSDYPSQDNEGHVPDRGSFKAGFLAALEYTKTESVRLRESLEWQNAITKALLEFQTKYVLENKKLREALEECAKSPYQDSDLSSLIQTINATARGALEDK